MLNVDADQVAFKISSSLNVEKLIILTDVPGVIINGGIVKEIKADEIEKLINKMGAGMNRKLIKAANAISEGVSEVVIAPGIVDDPIGKF